MEYIPGLFAIAVANTSLQEKRLSREASMRSLIFFTTR
jgi:hypothetical protein